MKLLRIFIINLIVAGVLILAPQLTRAQTGIQISPLAFNIEINAGGSATGKIIITNVNNEVMNYICDVENFRGVTDDGAP